jgi:hypothetical protein
MTQHVDVIKVDPLAGVQERVATLTADGDRVRIEPADWTERIERLVGPLGDQRPDDYLLAVVERLADATYVTASEPHDDERCPFSEGKQLRLGADRERHLAGT